VKKDQAVVVEEAVMAAAKWNGPTPIADSFVRDENEVVVVTMEDEEEAPPTYENVEQEEKQALLDEKA